MEARNENHYRERQGKRRKFGQPLAYAAVIIVGVVGIFWGLNITGFLVDTNKYDDFAQCLTERGAVMYGSFSCGACQRQKLEFGSAFRYISYVECNPNGKDSHTDLCEAGGIEYMPTWIYNGEKHFGYQTLGELAQMTGCRLP